MSNGSMGFSPLTIAAALEAAGDRIGPHELSPVNPRQQELTADLRLYLAALSAYKADTYGFVADNAADLNRKLREAGFDIQVDGWPESPNRFGAAGVTDALGHWLASGTLVPIDARDGGRYPGFALKEAAQVISVGGFGQPIVMGYTKEGLRLRAVMTDAPESQLDLMRRARELHEADVDRERREDHSAVHLPMVHLQQQPDISWLCGLRLIGADDWEIAQAMQEVRFAMNQDGFRVKEATAVALKRMALIERKTKPYVVNSSFLVTIGREGAAVPLFGAYVTPADWKELADLGSL